LQELISCILPTRNRAKLIHYPIDSFLSQSYQNIELVILDNGDDETKALLPDDPRIRYERIQGNVTVGMMRNKCCEMATGDIIAHFDSDDWSDPCRLEQQVAALGADGVLTGYCDMLFYDIRDGGCYLWSIHAYKFALGTSLVYRKAWWYQHPFDNAMSVGEDFKFVQDSVRADSAHVSTPNVGKMMVALVHNEQTSVKTLQSETYQRVNHQQMPEAFLALQHRD
jgi:glycosyltransferase involved in cell wall biosynthesis